MRLKEVIMEIEELFQTSRLSNEQIADKMGVTAAFVERVWVEWLQEQMEARCEA